MAKTGENRFLRLFFFWDRGKIFSNTLPVVYFWIWWHSSKTKKCILVLDIGEYGHSGTWANGNMREGANGEINGSIQDNWDRYRTF